VRIAIIGVGNVGSALARVSVGTGHTVVLASRNPQRAADVAAVIGADLGAEIGVEAAPSVVEAVHGADLVVLAVPSTAVAGIADDIRQHVTGTIVVDPTNPVRDDMAGLLSDSGSVAEGAQLLLPDAFVVKALNTIFAGRLADPVIDGIPLDGFYAGDDAAAKARVAELLAAIGLRPLDVGALPMARALEEMALVNISFNVRYGWPWQTGWKLLGPTG
jgi:8-hydroxy-5-deazaflavin:NADPH oxidoreductase